KRRGLLLPLWSKIAGAAAVVVLIVLLGQSVFTDPASPSVVTGEPAQPTLTPKTNTTSRGISRYPEKTKPESRQEAPDFEQSTNSEGAANNHSSNTITPPSTLAKNKQTEPSQSTADKSATTPLTNHKQPNQNRALSANQTGETSGNTRENPANTTSGYVVSEHTTAKNKPAVNQLSEDQPSPSTKLVSEQLATVTSSEQDKTKVTKKAQSSAADSLKGGKNLLKAIAETNQAKATEKLAKAQQEGGLLQHLRLRP